MQRGVVSSFVQNNPQPWYLHSHWMVTVHPMAITSLGLTEMEGLG